MLAWSVVQTGMAAVDFEKDIAPVLAEHCLECHGDEKQKGKLRLDLREEAFKGGKSGTPGVVAGDPSKSELVTRVALPKDHDDLMPPEGGPLPEKTVELLKEWITAGAAWPDGFVVKVAAKSGAAVGEAPATPAMPRRPLPPLPELPKDFQVGAAEKAALAALAQGGIEPRAIAQNVPWTELNLRLKGAEVTDAVVEGLKPVSSLVELRLGNTKVTDAALAAVAALPQLQVLSLELTGVTDAGLAHLKDLKNLVYLNLYGTKVTDAGLEVLKGMKHLRNVYLWQTQVTPEGAKALSEALPGCDVNLGVDLAPAVEEKKEEPKAEAAKS